MLSDYSLIRKIIKLFKIELVFRTIAVRKVAAYVRTYGTGNRYLPATTYQWSTVRYLFFVS
jgi:hypothetical protein